MIADITKLMAELHIPLTNISVNMLNEGIHVPHVDGIIMLRSTISRLIIEQQIGRCLTAENILKRPVVLDLVNNMDTMLLDYCKTYSFGGGSNGNNESSSNKFLIRPP